MKRTLWMVLMGTSFLIPIEAEAQRYGARNAPASRQIAPVSARLANCRAPSGGRAYACRNDVHTNVVYRYAGDRRNRFRRAWVVAHWGGSTCTRFGIALGAERSASAGSETCWEPGRFGAHVISAGARD